MSMRFSRDCDACDGDGQCEFCSVEFHLRAKCHSDQTLDVTSKDLYSSDHSVVPVDFVDPAGYDSTDQQRLIFFLKVILTIKFIFSNLEIFLFYNLVMLLTPFPKISNLLV